MSKFHSARKGLKMYNEQRCYPTGCEMFNLAVGMFDPITGRPGIPAGTVVEAFGPNASLKTALWESLAKNVLDSDPEAKVFALLSEEPDYKRFENLGMDLDRLLVWTYYNPDNPKEIGSADEGMNLILEQVANDMNAKLCVVDSIKALISDNLLFDKKGKEIKDISEQEALCDRAKFMNRFCGTFAAVNKSRAILFMVNQTSESIGPNYMVGGNHKTKTSGGRGKEHWAKIRVECNSTVPDQTDKPEEHVIYKNKIYEHFKTVYYFEKNKFGYPFRKVIVDFDHIEGYRYLNEKSCLSVAEALGIVQRKGNTHWALPGIEKSFVGRAAAEQYLADNLEYQENIWKEIHPRHEEFFGSSKKVGAKEALEYDD